MTAGPSCTFIIRKLAKQHKALYIKKCFPDVYSRVSCIAPSAVPGKLVETGVFVEFYLKMRQEHSADHLSPALIWVLFNSSGHAFLCVSLYFHSTDKTMSGKKQKWFKDGSCFHVNKACWCGLQLCAASGAVRGVGSFSLQYLQSSWL